MAAAIQRASYTQRTYPESVWLGRIVKMGRAISVLEALIDWYNLRMRPCACTSATARPLPHQQADGIPGTWSV